MKDFGRTLKQLRESNALSQRALAEESGVSFRQIQRIESGESEPTISLASKLLKVFDRNLETSMREPHWNFLKLFGIPVSISGKAKPFEQAWQELRYSIEFLYHHQSDRSLGRFRDGVKAIVLTLKTHYPSLFDDLRLVTPSDQIQSLNLNEIRGRDIKLRNIALGSMALKL